MTVSPRTFGLMVAAALAAGWFGATVTQNAAPQQTRVSSGVRPVGSPVTVPHAAKLRERLTEPPMPARGRNPFVFGSRVPSRASSFRDRSTEPDLAPPPAPVPLPPPLPVIRLSGIASDTTDGVTVFTAILNDNGALVFAKAGDKLSNGHSVVRVEELSVTIIDSAGVTQTIRLP